MRIRTIALAALLAALSVAAPSRAADLWQPIGPGGGLAVRAAADPLMQGRLFAVWAGGERLEVYRRDPGAAAWSLANRGLDGKRPDALAFHPTQAGTLWAATLRPLAVYRSTDAGASWQRRFQGAFGDRPYGLWSIRSGKTAALLGWFGTVLPEAKILRSRDAGHTWTEIPGVSGPVAVLGGTSTAFALGSDRRALVRSNDAGATWSRSGTLPVDADDDLLIALTAWTARRSILLASFAQAGLFRSVDLGAHWVRVGPAGAGPSSVVATPRALFAAFPGGLRESLDGGVTWHLLPSASYPPGVVALASAPGSGVLYAQSQERGDLSQSRDGGRTWTRIPPRGVLQFAVVDFGWHPLDPRVQALLRGNLTPVGSTKELLSSVDNGATWRTSPFQSFTFDPDDPHVLYAGSGAGVFVTHDNGKTWEALRAEPTAVLLHTGAGLFAAGCGIARSEDDGAHWVDVLPCNAPPSAELPGGANLLPRRLLVRPTDSNVVWAEVSEVTTVDGHPQTVTVPYFSFDSGFTWTRLRLFEPHIVLSAAGGETVWDIGGFVLRRSDDGGLTWRLVPIGGEIYDLVIDQRDPTLLIAVGTQAVMSHDAGTTWSEAFDLDELAPWGTDRRYPYRVFLHPTQTGRIAVAPGTGLLLRNAPL